MTGHPQEAAQGGAEASCQPSLPNPAQRGPWKGLLSIIRLMLAMSS